MRWVIVNPIFAIFAESQLDLLARLTLSDRAWRTYPT